MSAVMNDGEERVEVSLYRGYDLKSFPAELIVGRAAGGCRHLTLRWEGEPVSVMEASSYFEAFEALRRELPAKYSMATEQGGEFLPMSLRSADGREHSAVVIVASEMSGRRNLTLRWEGGSISAAAMGSYFDALVSLRQQLPAGTLLLCHGASRDCWPLPSRRYRHEDGSHICRLLPGPREPGQPLRYEDDIFTFGWGPDIDPCTPDEQRVFYENWSGLRKAGRAKGA